MWNAAWQYNWFHSINSKQSPMPFKILSGNVTFHRRFFPLSLSLLKEARRDNLRAILSLRWFPSFPHILTSLAKQNICILKDSGSVCPSNTTTTLHWGRKIFPHIRMSLAKQNISIRKDSGSVCHLSIKKTVRQLVICLSNATTTQRAQRKTSFQSLVHPLHKL